jgi:hypothetical protein
MIPAEPLFWVATAGLLVFAAAAAFDGVYIHLWKLRLHARPGSYAEHLWHTASALVFVPIVALLFARPSTGPLLWLAMALLVVLHVVEVLDVRAEPDSRRDLGGLSAGELGIHVLAVVSRTAAIAALLLAQPVGIWTGRAAELPRFVADVGVAVTAGAIAIAILHVVLAALHCPICARAPAVRSGAAP